MNLHRFRGLLVTLTPCFVAFVLLACGSDNGSATGAAAQPAAIGIRTPHPTFTPTPLGDAQAPTLITATLAVVGPTATPVAQLATIAPATPTATPTTPPVATDTPTALPAAKPKLVVNSGDVNVRAGPGTTFEIIKMVDRGQEYDLVGKNADGDWWQVCCIDGKTGWIVGEFADTDGPVDQLPVVSGEVANVGGATTAPATDTETPTAPTAASAPTLGFDLVVQEQFPENKLVRIFLYVYDKDGGLADYSLHVTKDGAELPVKTTSFGGSPGLTWPVADVRQRSQNMKVEFPGVAQAGVWVVELVKDGAVVGPAATFTVAANDPKQELYVRYQKR